MVCVREILIVNDVAIHISASYSSANVFDYNITEVTDTPA